MGVRSRIQSSLRIFSVLVRTCLCGDPWAARAATSAIIRIRVLLESEISGYTPPIRRAFWLSLKSRMTAAFVHLFLRVSGETIVRSA